MHIANMSRKAMMGLLLALCLIVGVAGTAGAAPKVIGPPKIPDCSSWSNVGTSGWLSNSAYITVQLQRGSPGYCTNLRDKITYSNFTGQIYGWTCTQSGGYQCALNESGLFGGPSGTWYTYSYEWGASFPGNFRGEADIYDWDGTTYEGTAYGGWVYLS